MQNVVDAMKIEHDERTRHFIETGCLQINRSTVDDRDADEERDS